MQEKQEKQENYVIGTTSERNLSIEQIIKKRREEEVTLVGFDLALSQIKKGFKMRRLQWEPNEFIFLVPGSQFKVNRTPLLDIYEEGTEITYQPHIDKCQSDGSIMVWNPSNEEMLCTDWIVYK